MEQKFINERELLSKIYVKKQKMSQLRLGHNLGITDNQKKLMMKSQKNAKKTGFAGIFRPEKNFFENWALSHFGHCHLHHCAEIQEKLMEIRVEIGKKPMSWNFLKTNF